MALVHECEPWLWYFDQPPCSACQLERRVREYRHHLWHGVMLAAMANAMFWCFTGLAATWSVRLVVLVVTLWAYEGAVSYLTWRR